MIQWAKKKAPNTVVFQNTLSLYDKMTNSSYKVLVGLTSQFTGKSKFYTPTTSYTNKDRFLNLVTFIAPSGSENLTAGIIFLGDKEYPLGFYDVEIYQNSSNTNLDPSGLTLIYTGLMNLVGQDTESVTYSEYTTNDSETEVVYTTFEI